ncbi:outer membrane protein [Roseibium limicola]|uniref:Porin family protein n=1 Tax=Roseibium limicola TaxID=2816037 RepID=A0A939EQN8_9HYPH|nr:outer membrane protein [Roseibium limicola]MBO0346904.1 porin family protein [Roseibium limicola]
MVICIKRLSFAGFAVTLATTAMAADLPAPVIEHIPQVPVAAAGGWYLRGDIGYKLYNDPKGGFVDSSTVGDLRYERESIDDTWMIGVGVGYQFNDYFRSDLTLDYEAKATARGYAVCGTCSTNFSEERTDLDIWTVMLNGYVDLGTWYNLTPYVGAGVGASYIRASNTISINPGSTAATYDKDNGEFNFAWALMAGASYAVNQNLSIDAGYQYRDLGKARTTAYTATGNGRSEFKDITAHEIRLGMRYTFDSAAPAYYAPEPIMSNF